MNIFKQSYHAGFVSVFLASVSVLPFAITDEITMASEETTSTSSLLETSSLPVEKSTEKPAEKPAEKLAEKLAEKKPEKQPVNSLVELDKKNRHWTDFRGKTWNQEEFKDSRAVVYAFLGVECPLAQLYASKLVELEKEFNSKGIRFIAVNPNVQDSLSEMSAQARRLGIEFPYIKDPDQTWADELGVTRTPEVCVITEDNQLVYRGRIDDQYGIGYQREKATVNDLADVLQKIANGESINPTTTATIGCLLGRNAPPQGALTESELTDDSGANDSTQMRPNYAEHVSHLLAKRCVSCHRDGEIGPMSFTNYDDVVAWSDMILEVVHDKRMPPWHASPEHGDFENDRRLSPEEIAILQNWADHGKPRGNPALDAKIENAETGWQIAGTPDLILPMADKPFQINARGDIAYQYFEVDPGHKDDLWLRGMEIMPGNRAVVHHILVFTFDKKSKKFGGLGGGEGFLAGYVPGTRAVALPSGHGKRIPKDHSLVFQVHYTPNGTAQEDLSKIAFWFADPDTLTHEVHTASALQANLQIPPFDANYKATAKLRRPLPESTLLAMSPHMHLRGKSFRYTLKFPDGTSQTILDIPKYDFNWQTEYRLRNPIHLPEGADIVCDAVFDNSENNLNNPDPSQTVRWGDQTYQEMMIGYFHIATKLE